MSDIAIDNAFELLGLPASFDLDEHSVQQAYLRRARETHPDRLASRPPHEQADAARLSARLNAAHSVLRDPVRRAEHLLRLAGGPDARDEREVPRDVLNETLILREEIDEARGARDHSAMMSLRKTVEEKYESLLILIADAARALSESPDAQRTLRLRLNSVRYYERMLEQLDS